MDPTRDSRVFTTKQLQILQVIATGDGMDEKGEFLPVDMDELIALVPYKTSKQSMQFSVRALIRRGLITKSDRVQRRGRSRVTFTLTESGQTVFKKPEPAMVSDPGLDELLEDLDN